jgi:hypothetical protein
MACKARIPKIDFRRFDDSFPEILKKRRNNNNLPCYFQNIQPFRYSQNRNNERSGQICSVKYLSAATNSKSEESAEYIS